MLSFFMLIGILGALFGNTPETLKVEYGYVENLLSSFKDFFKRIGLISASVLLFIIATYRLTDIIMGPMAMPFYIDMGYSKTEIGAIVKTVALGASILGFFVGSRRPGLWALGPTPRIGARYAWDPGPGQCQQPHIP